MNPAGNGKLTVEIIYFLDIYESSMTNNELAFRSSQAATLVCVWISMEQNQKFAPLEIEMQQLIVVTNVWEFNSICWVRMDINIHVHI